MTAIELSLNVFRNICQLTETKIAEHFKKVDESVKGSDSDTLHISELADDVASSLELKPTEILSSIYLYLRNRSDLEVRSGKGGGICRVGDERVKAAMTPKECGLKFYDSVKEVAPPIIDDAFLVAENEALTNGVASNKVRLNFKNVCEKIADKLNVKPYAVYHCLKHYIEVERNKDWHIALGRQGGLMKK